MVIDFGNGITCDTEGPSDTCPAGLLAGDSGLDAPDVELSMTENSNLDGAVYFGSRVPGRRMVLPVGHELAWTKRELQQAFTPGVLRTISTELGSMPYYVERLMFPKLESEARRAFSVRIASPLAYPLGAVLESLASTTYTYTTTTHAAGTVKTNVDTYDSSSCRIAETVPVPSGDKLAFAGFKTKKLVSTVSVALRLYRYTSSMADATLVASRVGYLPGAISTIAYAGVFCFEISAGDNYFVEMEYDPAKVAPYSETAATAAGREAYYWNGTAWVAGDSDDSTTDWAHRYEIGTPDTDSTTVYLDPQTDVECYPVITITLAEATEELTVTDGVNTTVLTGSMEIGDVVIIDSNPASLTVTVNGTDRLTWFSGDFPLLYPDSGYIESSASGTIGVTWQPRLMGLI